jgi:hypothetical protein
MRVHLGWMDQDPLVGAQLGRVGVEDQLKPVPVLNSGQAVTVSSELVRDRWKNFHRWTNLHLWQSDCDFIKRATHGGLYERLSHEVLDVVKRQRRTPGQPFGERAGIRRERGQPLPGPAQTAGREQIHTRLVSKVRTPGGYPALFSRLVKEANRAAGLADQTRAGRHAIELI